MSLSTRREALRTSSVVMEESWSSSKLVVSSTIAVAIFLPFFSNY
uniref:26S protease regulatory subunit 6A isogeny n=1 Tax=Rhizophora mucronata TaxID=61149 RepID=A0A2P2MLG5_RHIMU